METMTCIEIALTQKYLSEEQYNQINSLIQELYFKLISLDKFLTKWQLEQLEHLEQLQQLDHDFVFSSRFQYQENLADVQLVFNNRYCPGLGFFPRLRQSVDSLFCRLFFDNNEFFQLLVFW